jgi:hypothetical protein
VTPPILSLVFSTRSPSPKSGSDFVREVVAESPGVAPEVRAEFARRADIAGSVLQRQLANPVYMFCPAGDAWLLCRAVSLGLYRKGSNQLLVHGLVLGEEHLDILDCNPLLLDDEELGPTSGVKFLHDHPGSNPWLPELALDDQIAPRAREVNGGRLAKIRGLGYDAQLAAAYGALAGGRRAGLMTLVPGPAPVKDILLHFHPDDRRELSFHTFYSHSRPLDYRLLLLIPEDAAAARGHFSDLQLLDLDGSPPNLAAGDLGNLAIRLRRRSVADFLGAVETYRVTHWSRRYLPPLAPEDAGLCLRAGLGESPTPAEQRRLRELAARGQRGLRYRLTEMARTWRDEPGEFPAQLAEMARTEDRVTVRELTEVLQSPPPGMDERWCLLALLARDEGLQPGEDWGKERTRVWRALMSGRLAAFLEGLSAAQVPAAEPILLEYALGDLAAGGGPDPPGQDWEALLAWIGRRGSIPKPVLSRVEVTLARLAGEPAFDGWRRLQPLLFEAGQPGDALRLFFSRTLPLLPAVEATERARSALRWWLDHGDEHDAEVAPSLAVWRVAESALVLLGDWFAEVTLDDQEQAFRRLKRVLASLDELPESAGPACGHLLARVALTRYGDRLPVILDACIRALPRSVPQAADFVSAALVHASETLVRELESAEGTEMPLLLDSVAALLAARNRHRATGEADVSLLRLAVLGRVLARQGRALPQGPAALNRQWPDFLRSDRFVEFLRAHGTDGPPPFATFPTLQDCLDLLQDEITAAPAQNAEDDPRFGLFTRLAWWQWCREQGRTELRALSAKLYQMRTWGRHSASPEWLWLRMEELVPAGPLRARAAALLPPQVESRWPGWLPFGGRR